MNHNTLLIKDHYQASLSNQIKDEFNKLILIVSSIPLSQRDIAIINGTGGKVSIANVIAYQIGWGNLLIGWYQSGLSGKDPEMPGDGFSKWDYVGIAHHFYQKYYYNNEDQSRQFYQVVQDIIRIVEHEYATGNLDKEGVWNWCTLSSGKKWPLSKWIRINTIAPYKRASTLIKTAFL